MSGASGAHLFHFFVLAVPPIISFCEKFFQALDIDMADHVPRRFSVLEALRLQAWTRWCLDLLHTKVAGFGCVFLKLANHTYVVEYLRIMQVCKRSANIK